MTSFFDKSTSKMMIDIIAVGAASENILLAKMLKTWADEGEFKKAAEFVQELLIEKAQCKARIIEARKLLY